MKRHFVLGVLLSVAFSSSLVFAYTGPGSGTAEDPYQIWTADQLHEMSDDSAYWDKHFILSADIDLSAYTGMSFNIIGNETTAFTGVFDGNGHVISNLTVDTEYTAIDYIGLFGRVKGYDAVIKNLGVKNVNINTGPTSLYVGGLAGYIKNGTITNCYVTGIVQGGNDLGGLVGHNNGGNIINCYATGTLSYGNRTGGLIGYNNGTVTNCYALASILYTGNTGNLVGENSPTGVFSKCFWYRYATYQYSGVGNMADPEDVIRTETKDAHAMFISHGWDFTGETANGSEDTWRMICGDYPVLSWQHFGTTPDVMGLSEESAVGLITAAGIEAATNRIFSYEPKGQIISQEPQASCEANTVTINISDGWPFEIGSGSKNTPYRISTAEQLIALGKDSGFWDKYFILTADIDMSGKSMNMIGNSSTYFSGGFDGNGKCISNLHIENQHGFIYYIYGRSTEDAYLQNLTLVDPVLIMSRPDIDAGILALRVGSYGYIENCHVVNGVVEAPLFYDNDNQIWGSSVGGLVSDNYDTIRNCSFSGTITGARAGGIAAYCSSAAITEDCRAEVDIFASRGAGGAVAQNSGHITRCSSSGTIVSTASDTASTGGLMGFCGNYNGKIIDCYSTCDVTTNGEGVGGLVGVSYGGTIRNCWASGNVSGYKQLGGLIGWIGTHVSLYENNIGTVENCYATGNISGHDRIGGLIGDNGSSYVLNCYSTGNVTGTEIVGGFVGTNFDPYNDNAKGIIEKCWSNGKVTASSEKGGFVGRHWQQSIEVWDCFWDIETSGMTYSSGGTGLTTEEMQTHSFYSSVYWDFVNVWYMSTYPVMQWGINPLQEQIDAAVDGDVITVVPGEYSGKLFFKGKNITLVSSDPTNPDIVTTTVLRGAGVGPVITFDGSEDANCVLDGFTITGGNNVTSGGGILGNASTATIQNCVIEGNQVIGSTGGGIWGINGLIENCVIRNNIAASGSGLTQCNGVIVNCLIVNNQGGTLRKCNGTISNCTIIGESSDPIEPLKACDGVIENCILQPGAGVMFNNSNPTIRYSCYPGATGEGNIDSDPQFANAAQGNYHLAGSSPCVDAGDPASDYSNEPLPNGGRVNMGAYGNTAEAAGYSLAGDITGDGDVNMKDFAALATQWQQTPSAPSADIALPLDGFVGMEDLIYLAENWLAADAE